MIFGKLALQVGGQPNPRQRACLRQQSLRIKHDEDKTQGNAMPIVRRPMATTLWLCVNSTPMEEKMGPRCYDDVR